MIVEPCLKLHVSVCMHSCRSWIAISGSQHQELWCCLECIFGEAVSQAGDCLAYEASTYVTTTVKSSLIFLGILVPPEPACMEHAPQPVHYMRKNHMGRSRSMKQQVILVSSASCFFALSTFTIFYQLTSLVHVVHIYRK